MIWLGFFALLAIAANNQIEQLKKLWENIELLNNIRTSIQAVDEKVKTLEQKMDAVCSVEEDINTQLENAEFQHGKKRKREVDTWLKNVQRKKRDIQDLKRKIGQTNRYLQPLQGSDLDKNITEVVELYEQGKFSEGLHLDVPQTSREALVTAPLVGRNSTENRDNILADLENNEVLRIGVHGVEGVGKTNIVMHVYNQLLQSTGLCGNVYWVTVPEPLDIHKLQKEIAKEVGLDLLEEEDIKRRAAKLFKALTTKGRSVLILDDIWKHFSVEDIGIPNRADGCKLVLTSRSLKVCRQMACQKFISVEPLSVEEAENFYMEKLGRPIHLAPETEEIAKLIIKECGGLPPQIIDMANRTRGVNDISEWRDTLNEVMDHKRGFND